MVRTRSILERELNIRTEGTRIGYILLHPFESLFPGHAELILQMEIGSCEEYMYARSLGDLHSIPCSIDILPDAARERSDSDIAYGTRNRLNALCISRGGDGKARFDYVDP